ncbi:SIR2 family protein [Dyadobacter sp. 3J3]|uniref:SIR2 family protein n=1 Tax=Dyadobacter sp. 3J3 TaxID=2606600 RepID=UPI001356D336|nr:SIR2 family protein [Dyadobacter sp. 3J3]
MSKERLFKLIRTERVALFVGSGMSCYAGYPSASAFKNNILTQINRPEDYRLNAESSLLDVSEALVSQSGTKRTLNKLVIDVFGKKPVDTSIHDTIAKIPHFKTIITTNYDRLFEIAYERRISPVITDQDLTYTDNFQVELFKVHGCVTRPERIILSRNDYNNFFVENLDQSLYWTVVKERIISKPVVFIGYSLGDDNINIILDRIFKALGDHKHECFLVAPGWNMPDQVALARRNITYVDSGAQEFFDELTKDIKENIYSDFKSDFINAETLQDFIANYNLNLQLTGVKGPNKTVSIIPAGPEVNVLLEFKTDLEVAKIIRKYINSDSFDELILKNDQIKNFSVSLEGIRVPEDISELFISPSPTRTIIGDIRFDDDTAYEQVEFSIYSKKDKTKVSFTIKRSKIEILIDRKRSTMGASGKVFLDYSCVHEEICGSVKEEIENFQFLCNAFGGHRFKLFVDNKPIFEGALNKDTVSHKSWQGYQEHFILLKKIEKFKSLSFSGLKFNDIIQANWENARFVCKALDGEQIEQEWKKEMDVWVNEKDTEVMMSVKNLSSSENAFMFSGKETFLPVHDQQINIGYSTFIVQKPSLTRQGNVDNRGLTCYKLTSSSQTIHLLFTKQYQGAPDGKENASLTYIG